MIIVTHKNPDLDGICAVWLLKNFGSEEMKDAEIKFVNAGDTLEGGKVDTDIGVIHVDTGLGRFDHHQTSVKTSASEKVLKYLIENSFIKEGEKKEAAKRMVKVVTDIDFIPADFGYPQPADDRYAFLFNERQIICGWQRHFRGQDEKILEGGMMVMDGVYENFLGRVKSEEVIKNAVHFKTAWGRGIGAETNIFGFMGYAQMKGYRVVVSKDPKSGHVRIHAFNKKEEEKIDLTQVYEVLQNKDPEATWYLHPSRKLLLNGSKSNPEMRPTKLSLKEVIKVIENL